MPRRAAVDAAPEREPDGDAGPAAGGRGRRDEGGSDGEDTSCLRPDDGAVNYQSQERKRLVVKANVVG